MVTKLAAEDALKRLPDELRDVVVLYYFQDLKLSDLLTQFQFPMVVTACICFGVLCNKHHFSFGVKGGDEYAVF